MATEIWHDFGDDAPVTLIPVASGRLEVIADGDVLFDRKAESGVYPEMKRVREIKQQIKQKLQALASAR
jgi:predicted Rdx family selenoprotein